MSEYYRSRRSQIIDLTGLVFFVIGWLGAAPFAWPYITRGFESGNPTKGIFIFALWAFGSGIGLGLCGMGLGAVGARVWEWLHRERRSRVNQLRPATVATASVAKSSSASSAPVPRHALPPLRYETGPIEFNSYVALTQTVGEASFDPARAQKALENSVNVSAWHGDQLVGIARVVTDGYFFAALAEIVVDPRLQCRGLGRELLNRVFERTPRGVLFIGAPFGNSAFFDAVGCERGTTGFTMRKALTESVNREREPRALTEGVNRGR